MKHNNNVYIVSSRYITVLESSTCTIYQIQKSFVGTYSVQSTVYFHFVHFLNNRYNIVKWNFNHYYFTLCNYLLKFW